MWVYLHRSARVCACYIMSDVTCAHHLEFTYLIVCDLCENTEGFLYIGLLLSGQKAVVLQDAELCVSAWCLRL